MSGHARAKPDDLLRVGWLWLVILLMVIALLLCFCPARTGGVVKAFMSGFCLLILEIRRQKAIN